MPLSENKLYFSINFFNLKISSLKVNELFELLDQYIQRYGKTPIAWNTHSDFFNNYTFGTAIVQNGGVFFDENNDYYCDNGFCHVIGDGGNMLATEQAVLALDALTLAEEGSSLYEF